jgi:hypothetical protein
MKQDYFKAEPVVEGWTYWVEEQSQHEGLNLHIDADVLNSSTNFAWIYTNIPQIGVFRVKVIHGY